MNYLVGRSVMSAEQEEFQQALAALAEPRRIHCMCSTPPVEMYVRLSRGRYRLVCMPGTGGGHSADCAHYEPPASISGAAQVMGTAIEETEHGEVKLRLDFPLTKIAGRTPPAPSGEPSERAKADPTKLTMRGLLHYLWQEAEFHKWSPKMQDKRSEWVFYKYLSMAAANKSVKAGQLADLLVLPRPVATWERSEDKEHASLKLARASSDSAGTRRLALILGEVVAISPKMDAVQVTLRSMKEQPLLVPGDLYARLERGFALSMWDPSSDRLILLASYYTNPVGIPIISEAALMNTTSEYLPFENLFERRLIDGLIKSGRRFTKGLRFNLRSSIPLASAVLTDAECPTALFVVLPGVEQQGYADAVAEAEKAGLATWLWRAGPEEAPALPPIAARGQSGGRAAPYRS